MKITYWICKTSGMNDKGQKPYIPVIQFPNREEAYKAIEKVKAKNYIVLPQVED